jgi:hypothetical protein
VILSPREKQLLHRFAKSKTDVLSPNGSLEKADFEWLCRSIDSYIAENGKLTGLVVCVKSFPGWESLGTMFAHLKFVRDHHRKIGRIAAVTDRELLRIMTIISKHLVSAEASNFLPIKKQRRWRGWKPRNNPRRHPWNLCPWTQSERRARFGRSPLGSRTGLAIIAT